MRDLITESFKNLEFFEEPHKYLLHKSDGTSIELPSVSSVVHKFEPEVDWDGIRIKKAQKDGVDPEWLKRQWRENNLRSTSNGTIVHEFGEACMYFFQGRFDEIAEYTKMGISFRTVRNRLLLPSCMRIFFSITTYGLSCLRQRCIQD